VFSVTSVMQHLAAASSRNPRIGNSRKGSVI
jgi:hypothetical protein